MSEIEHVCFICKTKSDSSFENILSFGVWHTLADISVHNNCLYFLTNLPQIANNPIVDYDATNDFYGIDGENILGFLLQDIRDYAKKIYYRKCRYCKKRSAGTHCARKKCHSVFHFDCGQQNDVQYQFHGQFLALCPKHYDISEVKNIDYDAEHNCYICEEPLGEYHILNSIPSCCEINFYHRDCVKKAAYHQGYAMKCMTCCAPVDDSPGDQCDEIIKSKPRGEYIRFLEHRGIFVPKQEASWEAVPNAYAELLNVNIHFPCNATTCLCEKGKDANEKTGKWKIVKCMLCGGRGIHIGCLNAPKNEYMCPDCYIESQPAEFYKTLSQSIATAEPIPLSQSPEPVVNKTIRYVRKVTAYEAKLDQLTRAGPDPDSGWYITDVECYQGHRKSLVLRPPSAQVDPKLMPDDEFLREFERMQNERLEGFLETAEFRNTPISYMPAEDHRRFLRAKEDEKKKKKDRYRKEKGRAKRS